MNRIFQMAGLLFLAAATMLAQGAGSNSTKAPASFDLTAIDKAVDPCVDFSLNWAPTRFLLSGRVGTTHHLCHYPKCLRLPSPAL